jgi:surfeit locus 1 family protein
MNRAVIFPLVLGLAGLAVLLGLGFWQLERLAWKEDLLTRIAGRMEEPAAGLDRRFTEAADEWRPVAVSGRLEGPALRVLTSRRNDGPGFRIIRSLVLPDGRRVLADLGFLPDAAKDMTLPDGPVEVTGNLLWPDEVDSFTPAPDLAGNIWFARDLPLMADRLRAEPLLIVARSTAPPQSPDPMPVTVDLPNDHLEYAVTWFAMAALWVMMTVYALWRIKRRIV